MPKVCIVLATYNGEKYLPQMLDSLIAQTRAPDEIIVVDDGSSDSTPGILRDYEKKLPLQITALPQNTGHRKAFAKCLEIASQSLQGEDLIALADQDDIWLPRKIEILENVLAGSDGVKAPDMAYGDAQIIDGNGNVTAQSWRKAEHLLPTLGIKTQLTGFTNVTGCLTMFKASLLKDILPIPSGVPVHDQWITLCASLRNGYRAIDEAVIQYRIHGDNAIGQAGKHTWSEKLRTNLQWAKAVKDSPQYAKLSYSQQQFLTKYVDYMEVRFRSNFLPGWIPWLLANSSSINPHVHGVCSHMARALFGAVGIRFATRFLGKA